MPTTSAPPASSAHPPLPLRRTPPPRLDASESLRIAAIDVGSNSIHMIVSEVDADGAITPLWRMKEMVGLGRATFPSRTLSRETIDRAIAARPQCRQIILGKAADFATIERWFAAASDSRSAAGFAIGRSVFWEPSTAFLAGTKTAAESAAQICASYLRLVDAWRRLTVSY